MKRIPERRRRPVAVAVAAPAAADYSERRIQCGSCGNGMPLGAGWIIPQGFVICTECAAPVLRANLERRLELLAIQDAGPELRAVVLPAAITERAGPL